MSLSFYVYLQILTLDSKSPRFGKRHHFIPSLSSSSSLTHHQDQKGCKVARTKRLARRLANEGLPPLLWTSTMIQLIGRLPSIEGASVDHDHELQLLELQLNECGLEGSASPSKCLTYPRKRRAAKSLMTLWSQRDLLDCNHVSTQHLLSNININWDFNAFSFDRLTDGQNLATLCTYLFQELGLCRHFGLDSLLVWKFFSSIGKVQLLFS